MTRELDIHAHYQAQLAMKDVVIAELAEALARATDTLENVLSTDQDMLTYQDHDARDAQLINARALLATLANETASGEKP